MCVINLNPCLVAVRNCKWACGIWKPFENRMRTMRVVSVRLSETSLTTKPSNEGPGVLLSTVAGIQSHEHTSKHPIPAVPSSSFYDIDPDFHHVADMLKPGVHWTHLLFPEQSRSLAGYQMYFWIWPVWVQI